jgi:deoxyribodipyrimidine photolyase-related protein
MAEVDEEATYVWSSKSRIALFLSAMRHFRDALRKKGFPVAYHALGEQRGKASFASELGRAVKRLKPQKLILVEPGEWRVQESLTATAKQHGVELEIRPDRHFYCTHPDFEEHAGGRKQLRNECFYREMRRKLGVLMDGDQPLGGQWNYDRENRLSFGKDGPGRVPSPNPNSFAGVAWCFGKHDRPWAERPIFGKVRYMNANGLRREFDVEAYVRQVEPLSPGGEAAR